MSELGALVEWRLQLQSMRVETWRLAQPTSAAQAERVGGGREGRGRVALAMILPLGCVATAASTHFPTRNLTLYTDCTTCPRQEDVINVVMGWDGMALT